MKASEKRLVRLLDGSDRRFIIPVYQRPYSWKKENCQQLFNDLRAVHEKGYNSHFFGAVVYVTENNGSTDEFIVIDGQQRLTTVSLLLLAIRNYVQDHPKLGINIKPDEISDRYLRDPYSHHEKKLKLKLVEGDDKAYDTLMANHEPVPDTNITANYLFFYHKIKSLAPTEIRDLYDAISQLHVVGVSLKTSDGDDPQLIFESLNSTGMDLTEVDKIRNYVLMSMTSAEQTQFYKHYWEKLEQMCPRDEINAFVRFYLAIKTRQLPNEGRLYIEFKRYREAHKDESVQDIVNDMLTYVQLYDMIITPEKAAPCFVPVLSRLKQLMLKTSTPILMDILYAYKQGLMAQGEAAKSIELIENMIVRRDICRLATSVLTRFFVQLGGENDAEVAKGKKYAEALEYNVMRQKGRTRFPGDIEFAQEFAHYDIYNSKPAMKKYVLERLENYNNPETVDVVKLVDEHQLTIEHVMPQQLTQEWMSELGDSWEIVHAKYLHTIGNITLTAYNSDYSNQPFKTKRDMPEKGFTHSKLSLNDYIKQCSTWGEEQIKERAKLLYTKAEKIWWAPKVTQTEGNDDSWHDWDDDVDIAFTQITKVSLGGYVFDTNSVTDAYMKIHTLLYDLDPTKYHNSNFNWFHTNENAFRTAGKIADNAYVEKNFSSPDKMKVIRTVAKAFGLSPADLRLQLKPIKETDAQQDGLFDETN